MRDNPFDRNLRLAEFRQFTEDQAVVRDRARVGTQSSQPQTLCFLLCKRLFSLVFWGHGFHQLSKLKIRPCREVGPSVSISPDPINPGPGGVPSEQAWDPMVSHPCW